ncbi:MAG: hypothetical protein IPJ80_10500 [Saprospiraceae bacterium]|nr:hypothetical protein [Saprospiraceae bacterium]
MKVKLILFALFYLNLLNGQKHDYIWTLGTGNTFVDSIHGGTDIDFNYSPPQVKYVNRPTKFLYLTSSMSDFDGSLLYYSNGCSVINRNQQTLINGNALNPGNLFDKWCTGNNGYYVLLQSIINLPFINNNDKFGMFHLGGIEIKGLLNARINACYYSEIDIAAENGRGVLLRKNIPIITDTLGGFIKAVKHSDGQSWWIIAVGRNTNIYYRIKFFDGQIEGPYEQLVEDTCKNPNNTGQAVFSPDGSMYAHFDPWTGLIIYDFDRGTGLLKKREKIDFWYNPNSDFYYGGLSFSPNGRFLYLSTEKIMYQFDLTQTPIKNSRTILDSIDGSMSPYLITFLYHELAPDGKIYISSGNSVNLWGVINQPDEKGFACDFKQHNFRLATLNFWSIPNFPNYRLGPLVLTESIESNAYLITPNPASLHFAYDNLDKPGVLRIYNQHGQQVLFQKLSPYYHIVYVNKLPIGMYFTSLEVSGKIYWDKLLKI